MHSSIRVIGAIALGLVFDMSELPQAQDSR